MSFCQGDDHVPRDRRVHDEGTYSVGSIQDEDQESRYRLEKPARCLAPEVMSLLLFSLFSRCDNVVVGYRFPGFQLHDTPAFRGPHLLVKPFLMLASPLHRDRRRLCSVREPGSLHVDSSASAYSLCRLPHREHLA